MIRADDFPALWQQRPLGQVATFLDHLRRPITASERKPGPFPYFGANGQQDSVEGFIFDEPLVLLAEDGGNFGNPSRTISYEISGKTWVNNHAHVLRAKAGLTTHKFLNRVLSYYDVRPFISGTTRAKLTKGEAQRIPIPLPPPSEQQRIVELLEQADLLRRQRVEADQFADRIIPALFNYYFGEPTTNPMVSPTPPLRELVDFVSGATPSKENEAFWNGKIPWVSPKDMKQPELYDAIDHVSEDALAATNLKVLPSNTALIVVRGMILAHTVPVCLARVPVTINQDMKGLRAKGDVSAEFLQWALLGQRSVLLRLISTAAHGTRKLDLDALGSLQVPLPPPPKRDLIKKWTSIVREQQSAARKRTECCETIGQLWQTMLHRAFTGELTTQWREAHMNELLAEMEQQTKALKQTGSKP